MKSKRPKYVSKKQFSAYKKEILLTMKDLINTRPIIIDPDPYCIDRIRQELHGRMSEIEMKIYKFNPQNDYDEPTL